VGGSESGFEPLPEIETDSRQEEKKIESVFEDQLIDINLNDHGNERP